MATILRNDVINNDDSDVGEVKLSDVVRIEPRFLRSVNLERDFYTAAPLDGYVFTPAALSALVSIGGGVKSSHSRAFTLTGAYGSGKSAFALFASRYLSGYSDAGLRASVSRFEPRTATVFNACDPQGFWPVLLTGSREPIGRALWLGLFRAINSINTPAAAKTHRWMSKQWPTLSDDDIPTSKSVTELFAAVSQRARKDDPNCLGLFVVVDELGKLLEFAAMHPAQGDVHVLQDMAELAVRSGNDAVIFVSILHQGFEEYSQRLSVHQRMEWQKVQGRFQDIPFGDGPEETMRLVAHAVQHSSIVSRFEGLTAAMSANVSALRDLKLTPPTMSSSEFQEMLKSAYPLHPLTLRVLPFVFRRFGQNERSLFSFLSSGENHAFQDFIESNQLSEQNIPFYTLDMLYDYVVTALGSSLYTHSTSKLWAETADAILRLRDADPLQTSLMKVIGLLHILGEQTRVLPSREVLQFALSGTGADRSHIDNAIAKLQSATLITYRKFKNAYRPYEGSDIDLDTRLKEAKSHFAHGADGVSIANNLGATAPIVARRHSYRTGTLRFFEVRYCRPDQLETVACSIPERADGLLVLCIAANSEDAIGAERHAEQLTGGLESVIVGISEETEMLHDSAVSLECLRWVSENTPELRNDRIAQRELKERLAEATTLFEVQWEGLLRPREDAQPGTTWFYGGGPRQAPSYRALQELISEACDRAFGSAPILQNELINRRQISPAASAARRNLIDAMINHRGERSLSINGYPPELSMYRSVLETTGIHRQAGSGAWAFGTPTRDEGLRNLWGALDDYIFSGSSAAKAITVVADKMRAKPYGLADGPIPVLLCAFLIQHEHEVAVYEDNAFLTEMDAPAFERMIKRPGDFRIHGYRISGERKIVLDRFAKGLLRANDEYTLVNVVRSIYREFNRLPEFTQKTLSLSNEATALRNVIKLSHEPEQLLFVDLPTALGSSPFVADSDDRANADHFFQRWNRAMTEIVSAYDALVQRIERFFVEALGAGSWQELRERATLVAQYATELRLKSFVMRLADPSYQRREWVEAVAAGVRGKPPASWSDPDEAEFQTAVLGLVSPFRNLELLAFEKNQRRHDRGRGESTGYRLSVTSDSGHESSRITLVSKQDEESVERLATAALTEFNRVLKGSPNETRVAVIGRLMRIILNGENFD